MTWVGCFTETSEAGSTVGVIRGLWFRCETKGGSVHKGRANRTRKNSVWQQTGRRGLVQMQGEKS